MGDCEKIKVCNFFEDKMQQMPSIAALFRKRLCKTDNSECAIYYLYKFLETNNYHLSAEAEEKVSKVSSNLFPNEIGRIKKVISELSV